MSRAVTITGYGVLALAMLACQLAALLRRRTPTLGQALRPVKRSLAGRVALLLAWTWVGWHLFVRGGWR